MKRRQGGVAAIEFAFVLLALLFAMYGIATFGAVLYTKQVVARAAGDGARAVQLFPTLRNASGADLVAASNNIRNVVWDSLAGSLIVPLAHSTDASTRRAWIVQTVNVDVSAPGTALTVTVSYPYSEGQLLPWVPLFDTSRWMPATLVSRATTAL